MWKVAHLSPSRLPLLKSNESIKLTVEPVSLFKENNELFGVGRIALTELRFLFIGKDRSINGIELNVNLIKDVEYISGGFMRSKSKIRLHIKTTDDNSLEDPITSYSWTCEICSFTNNEGETECANCGIKYNAVRTYMEKLGLSRVDDHDEGEVNEPGVCARCTFRNHPSLAFCEVCMSPLLKLGTVPLGTTVLLELSNGDAKKLYNEIKDQINQSQQNKELIKNDNVTQNDEEKNISGTLDPKTNKDSMNNADDTDGRVNYGLKRLKLNQDTIIKQSQNILSTALSSPEGFLKVHQDVVKIASKYNLKPSDKVSVVRATRIDDSKSIALQLVDLLIGDDVLQRFGGMLSLYDLYALYNRSRGFVLVSPTQLMEALKLCDEMELPLHLRDMGRMKVIESRGSSTAMLLRLVNYIQKESQEVPWRATSGFSARDISEKFGYSVSIATEELKLAEEAGHLCRDEHISGLRFFVNHFRDGGWTA